MGSPATESSISQIVEKLDSLPNSERDAAVNNSISLSDSPGSFGEGVLKLYNENRSTIGWTGLNASAMDSPSKKSSFGNSIRFPKRLPMPSIRKDGPSKTMAFATSDI